MTTLKSIRRAAVSPRLGTLEILTTTSAATTTSEVLIASLISTEVAANVYGGGWLLPTDGAQAGQQRRLVENSLDITTGGLALDRAFTDKVASGVHLELHLRLPPHEDALRLTSIRSCVNSALQAVWYVDDLPITAVTGQTRYAAISTTYPWLTKKSRIVDIMGPTTAADDDRRAYGGSWDYVQDGETFTLVLPGEPYATGETFWVRALRPGNSRLKLNATAYATLSLATVGSLTPLTGGYYTVAPTVTLSGNATATAVLAVTPGPVTSFTVTGAGSGYTVAPTVTITRNAADTGWADQTDPLAGLAADDDEVPLDVHDVAIGARYFAYASLAQSSPTEAEMGLWAARAQEAAVAFRDVKRKYLPQVKPLGRLEMAYPSGDWLKSL